MYDVDSLGNLAGIGRPFIHSSQFTILSRVAFSENNDRAVVYYSNGAPGGGQYGFILFIRENEQWIIRSRLMNGWI